MKNESSIYLSAEEPWVACGLHLRNLEDQAMIAKRTGTPSTAVAAWIAKHVTHYERLWEGGDRTPELADEIMIEKFDADAAMKEASS